MKILRKNTLKNHIKVLTCGLISASLLFTLAACSGAPSGGPQTPSGEKAHLVMADAGWDSIRFHNAVVGTIAEVCYGYTWEELSGSTLLTFGALTDGQIDVYTEVWSELIPDYNPALEKGSFLELGVNFDDNAQGFYVPAYMIYGDSARGIEPVTPDLKTVKDLAKYADIFKDPEDPKKGRLYGAIAGWAVDEIMSKKVQAYGLDEHYNYFRPGNDVAIVTAIVSAYERGNPWVGYYWDPTFVSGKYDLVLLEDEPYTDELFETAECEIPPNRVTVGVSSGFAQSNPEFTDFLRNYTTSSEMTAKALAYMEDNRADYLATAKWFIKSNDALITSWLSEARQEALAQAMGNW